MAASVGGRPDEHSKPLNDVPVQRNTLEIHHPQISAIHVTVVGIWDDAKSSLYPDLNLLIEGACQWDCQWGCPQTERPCARTTRAEKRYLRVLRPYVRNLGPFEVVKTFGQADLQPCSHGDRSRIVVPQCHKGC